MVEDEEMRRRKGGLDENRILLFCWRALNLFPRRRFRFELFVRYFILTPPQTSVSSSSSQPGGSLKGLKGVTRLQEEDEPACRPHHAHTIQSLFPLTLEVGLSHHLTPACDLAESVQLYVQHAMV